MNFRVCKVENRHVEWENHRTKWAISHRVNDLKYLGAWNAWGNPAKWCPVCQFSWWKLSKLAIGFVVDIPLESFRHHGYGILPQKRSDTFGRSNYLLISWWLWHTFFQHIQNWPWIGYERLGGEARRHGMLTFDCAWVSEFSGRQQVSGRRTTWPSPANLGCSPWLEAPPFRSMISPTRLSN